MLTPLERFLTSISPARTWDGVGREVDATLNHLVLPHATVGSATELRSILTQVWREFHGRVWGLGAALPVINPDIEWDWCRRILDAVYGAPDGWRTALDLAGTGVRNGLRGVVGAFVEKACEQYLTQLIATGVQQLWPRQPYEARVAMITEYLAKYGQLLPPSLSHGSITDLIVDFPRVLKEHPRMMQRLSRLGRQ